MNLNKEQAAKAVGSFFGLCIYVLAIKFAFEFTWQQGIVLGWLYWLMHDACTNIKK